MKTLLFIPAFLLVLTSCETFCDSYIENRSNSDITMIVQMDTGVTRLYNVSRTGFLNSFANDSSSIKIGIDTINYIGVYLLKDKAIVEIDRGLGDHPDSKFSYLELRTKKDTIIFYSRIEIYKAFDHDIDPNDTKLTIK